MVACRFAIADQTTHYCDCSHRAPKCSPFFDNSLPFIALSSLEREPNNGHRARRIGLGTVPKATATPNHHYSDWTGNPHWAEAVVVEKSNLAPGTRAAGSRGAQSQRAVPRGPGAGVEHRDQLHWWRGARPAQPLLQEAVRYRPNSWMRRWQPVPRFAVASRIALIFASQKQNGWTSPPVLYRYGFNSSSHQPHIQPGQSRSKPRQGEGRRKNAE